MKVSSFAAVDFEEILWLSCNKLSQECCALPKETRLQDEPKLEVDRESGSAFMPKFGENGLLTAVVTDADSREVLMVAHMNSQAMDLTRSTGIAHFWSRSREALWKKGETSGNTLSVEEILVDCDQDALVLRVKPAGPACHTGARSCFYRRLDGDSLRSVNS